jgi:hypothetical protein
MITENEYAAVIVVGLGGESWCVDGDVWGSVWEVMVGGCRTCGPSLEDAKIPFKARVSVVERVEVDDVEVSSSLMSMESPSAKRHGYRGGPRWVLGIGP